MKRNKYGKFSPELFKRAEKVESKFWQKHGAVVLEYTLVILSALVFASWITPIAFRYYNKPIVSPRGGSHTIVKPVEAKESKEETKAQRMFNITRHHESSNGINTNPRALHNYCRNKGMWNEIGYSPFTKFCFGDKEEARLFMEYYVKRNCENKSLASCLCFWNTGKNVEMCAYSEGDLKNSN